MFGRRGLGVGGFDDVVLALQPSGDGIERGHPADAERAQDQSVRDECAQCTGLATENAVDAPLQAAGRNLLTSGGGSESDTRGHADTDCLDRSRHADTRDGMTLRRDDAICRGATAARQDADGDDGTARCDRGEEGGVESGAQAQATVEQRVPGGRGAAGQGGERGDAARRCDRRRGKGLVGMRAGGCRHGQPAGHARTGDDEVCAVAGSLARECAKGLQRGPGGCGQLVVRGRDHAGGDGLLHRMPREQAACQGARHRPRRPSDTRLHGGVGGPARQPVGPSGEEHHGADCGGW